MIYKNNDTLREYLGRGASGDYREHLHHPNFELDGTAFAATLDEVRVQHPGLDANEAEARAVFRLLTSGAPPEIATPRPSPWFRAKAHVQRTALSAWPWLRIAWAVTLLILAALTLLLVAARPAHAEPREKRPSGPFHVVQPVPVHAQFGTSAARMQFLSGGAWTNVSSASPLPITCISGCSGGGGGGGGTSSADESAFTQGTTALTPIGGFYSTSITNLSSGQTGAAQMTSDRKLFVQAFQGTSPWVVSNGGTFATQATQAGSWNVGQSGTWTVQPGNTANTTAWLVTGTGGTFPATQSGNWTARIVGNSGGALDAAGQNASSPANEVLVACQFNTTPTTITSGNVSPEQCDSKGSRNVDIQTIAGTAPTTAGKLDVKAADGDLFVRQATAANLNATVVGTGTFEVQPDGTTASTSNSATRCMLASAASTNSTNCKGSSGNVYGFRFVNTTTTVYYLRMYNASSAPTCSSATGFIESIPIPPAGASGGAGGIVSMEPFGEGYSTGIGFCLTGGSSSTDNTNAATGVFGAILYR